MLPSQNAFRLDLMNGICKFREEKRSPYIQIYATVVKLVDTRDLKSLGHCGRAGSIPAGGTKKKTFFDIIGSVAERLIALVLKTSEPERVPQVRILPLPLFCLRSSDGQSNALLRRRSQVRLLSGIQTVLQLSRLEQLTHNQQVVGSSPTGTTRIFYFSLELRKKVRIFIQIKRIIKNKMRKVFFTVAVIAIFASCSSNTEATSTDSTSCDSCVVDSTNTVDTASVDTVGVK